MASGTVPTPGSQYGPCITYCEHKDCHLHRQDAESACRICGKLIGFGGEYYREGERLVHAECFEEECEAKR